MTEVKRLDRETIRVGGEVKLHERTHAGYFARRMTEKLNAEVATRAPECAQCPHVGTGTERQPFSNTTFTEQHIATAFCKAGRCMEQEKHMTIRTSDIFSEGWTTSAPGDMKNSGLRTASAKTPVEPAVKWPFGERIKVEPRTEFDLDLASLTKSGSGSGTFDFNSIRPSKTMTGDGFHREYQTSRWREEQGAFLKDIPAPPPAADRDTPKGSLTNAW